MLAKLKVLLFTVCFLTAIPLLGLWIGTSVEKHYDEILISSVVKNTGATHEQAIERGISVRTLCSQERSSELSSACEEVDHILMLENASRYAFIAGLALIATVFLSAKAVGSSRVRLALLFNPVATLSIIVLSVSIFTQGIILVYGLYLAGSVYTGHVFPKIMLLLGAGAIFASIGLARAAFSFLKSKETIVWGRCITEENGAPLLAFINQWAQKVEAKTPDNVVLGVEPNFYVTAGKIKIAGEPNLLKGTTMYLSMPFLEIFTREELASVVGHELGHFKGEDTAFSMRFYPAYSKIYTALGSMSRQASTESLSALFALPAMSMLAFVLSNFSPIERTIGRARELQADTVGAHAGSKEAIVTALLKISQYANLWSGLRAHNVDRLAEGHIYANLPALFCLMAQNAYADLDFEAARGGLFEYQMAHPTDTHPTLLERILALDVPIELISKGSVASASTLLSHYFVDPEKMAEEISVSEHRLMVEAGLVVIPAATPA
jgi:Zn-dependent protease with chaperone function